VGTILCRMARTGAQGLSRTGVSRSEAEL